MRSEKSEEDDRENLRERRRFVGKKTLDLAEESGADTPARPKGVKIPAKKADATDVDDAVDADDEVGEEPTAEDILAGLKNTLEEIEFKLLDELNSLDNLLELDDATDGDIKKLEAKMERLRRQKSVKEEAIKIMEKKLAKDKPVIQPVIQPKKIERVVVPTGMPKFRQGGHFEEPSEFLDAFINVMIAHEIPMEQFGKLLVLCLDSVDGQWLKSKNLEEMTWTEIEEEFIAHFQHPNAIAVWQEKIRNLRVDGSGVQRYTDQFVRLVQRLRWDLYGEVAIYQYKQGLPEWIADRISTAEAAAVMTSPRRFGGEVSSHRTGVEALGRMALSIEASRRVQREPIRWKETFKNGPKPASTVQCPYCHNFGHAEAACRIKRKDAAKNKEPAKSNSTMTTNVSNRAEPKPGGQRTEYRAVNTLTCSNCGGRGHEARRCTSQKNVKALSVGKQEDNKPELPYAEVSQFLEVPCLINGKKVFGLLDTGANVSVIDQELVNKLRIQVKPAKGIINQAFEGNSLPRIGVVNVDIEVGRKKLKAVLEVAKLSGETKFIIGMDLFNQLDFKLSNVPITWPESKEERVDKPVAVMDNKIELPSSVNEHGIAEEWKKVLEDNMRIPVSSTCNLENSEVAINTEDAKPVYVRQYPIPQGLMERVLQRIQEWIDNKWIVSAPLNCPWNLPLIAANKPAKEIGEKDDIRLCLDARWINDKIIDSVDSNLPLLREVLDQLGDFQWITLLDLADSYHQFRLKKEDQVKTAFTINGKQWMFRVVPFGLKIMTGHMQRIMERLLKDLGVSPFQNDTAIASKTAEEHIQLVKKVLERITYDAGLRLKLKKCKFFQTEARVLGFYVTRTGLKMDPKKVKAITEWSRPKDGKGIQRFMGAANFNRDFSQQFARIAAPLDECRNDKEIEWTEEHIEAFDKLRELFKQKLELARVDWNKKIYLTSDASQIGVEAWLGQINEQGELVPVICASKKFDKTQQRWPATKRELYAVMWAMNKFRQYLIGRHFIARVDHKPLVGLLKNKSTMLTEGWLETIMQYTFTTEYLPGEENTIADALSRSHEGEINAINVSEESTLDEQWIAEQKGLKIPSMELRKELVEKQHVLGSFWN